jgi:LETM1 and EF-hand domain-containing protein 1
LELSLDDQVPPSLLLLSRAMFFSEELNFTERLRTIISALPKEVGEHTTLKLKELEGITDPKARLEQLKSIEQALKKEREEEKQRTKDKKAKEAEAAAVKELAKVSEAFAWNELPKTNSGS